MESRKNISAPLQNSFAELFASGEEAGFDFFFRQYYPALCLFAGRLTGDMEIAKDIASQSFLKTWAKNEKLPDAAAIRAYVFKVTRNDCYKWLKKEQRNSASIKEFAALSVPVAESHLQLMIESELLATLHNEIFHLPTGCRKVFEKLFVDGKSVAETAKELGLAITTVKTQKLRGLAVLRKNLGIE